LTESRDGLGREGLLVLVELRDVAQPVLDLELRALRLTFEMMELKADAGLTILPYTAEPGSRSEEALNLLASWTATPDEKQSTTVMDEA
jgi:hypothetical protein